ncbi:hypothetical protein B296_00039302 [Ensete ventricosum]|uniref:Uncharacterized protein n=1 Tax=Ensete ventricosum TaxID=4639 RepID=A0A426ZU31_ENSVE|nr:hypothetical protein B296_00039302 [Ensete ventricosum]
MAHESIRFDSVYVRKLVCVDRKGVGKLGRGRLVLLESGSRWVCSGVHLRLLHLGVYRGILHKGLVGPCVAPWSSSVVHVPDNIIHGVCLILVIVQLGYQLCQVDGRCDAWL